MNLEEINKELQNKSPEEIINWAITIAYKPIVTTNFRPYEVAILDAVTAFGVILGIIHNKPISMQKRLLKDWI
jgi:3'-phosphoadenosine 5'-phosphosulfate sulfotransferase (PAPS reductase)/FAD synthetase